MLGSAAQHLRVDEYDENLLHLPTVHDRLHAVKPLRVASQYLRLESQNEDAA